MPRNWHSAQTIMTPPQLTFLNCSMHADNWSSCRQSPFFLCCLSSKFAGSSGRNRQVGSPQQSRAGFLRTAAAMATTTSNMFLYSLTIQPPTTITQALLGQFSGTKEQQIITASGSRLTLLQPDPRQGKVNTIVSHDIFGIIRAMAAFRLAGSHKGESRSR